MLRKGILIALLVLLLTATVMLSGAGAGAPLPSILTRSTRLWRPSEGALLPGSTMAVPASPGDGDDDGIITGPRLVGGTVFRGCFASGPDPSGAADPDWDKDVDTITGALKGTGSWQDANMTKLKNGKRADIEACVNAAKGAAVPGDEFIFYFSGHGGNHTFQDGVQDQHETAADPEDDPDDFDNHLLLGDTTAGSRSRMSDDELAKLLSGFKQSVTIVVILDSCNSHTFTDGTADLGSVTQVDPAGNNVPATSHLALIAASTASNPTCTAGMTDRIADGLKSQGSHAKADKNKDGVVTAKEVADHAKAYLPELKPKCDETEPFACPMPEESGATYRGPLSPLVDNCPTVYNPDQEDTDGDNYGDVCDDDDDNDGLTDQQEIEEYHTNPLMADTDADEMPDGYEVRFYCLDALLPDAMVDSDGDGPLNLVEYQQGTDPCTYGSGDDYGDAPEGGLAYPALGVFGAFPTCTTIGPALWVQHGLGWAHFVWTGAPQLAWDAEPDGNAGLCPLCFPSYDADECYRDGDAGLMFPQPYTIDNFMNVTTCPNSLGTSLGTTCQVATWGGNVDIWIVNTMPVDAFVNVLMDWNQDGDWNDILTCPAYPGVPAPEHVLVNFPVPIGFNGPLSQLTPPNFLIGPKSGYAWARFTISEQPVPANWDGSGAFEDGESEDYLLQIADTAPGIKWSQLPNRTLPGLHAHDYLNASGAPESITLADDWLCQGGEVTDLHWWGNYELDAAQQERRGGGIANFHLSIHAPTAQDACLPAEPPLWQAVVSFGMVSETDTGLVNNEGSKIYKYTYYLPQPFPQTAGGSYWFDISAISQDINNPPMWRWQESARTTNPAFPPNQCGAAQKQSPPGSWLKMVWAPSPPGTLPRFSEMAFEVTSMAPEEADWGDAPDSAAAPGYPTLAANNGARHMLVSNGPFMGTAVDPDPDGQPTAAADGDDADADGDDEDSVSFSSPPLRWADPWATVWVDFSSSPAGCYVNGWLDFNGNSNWNDPGEQIVSDFWMAPGPGNSYGWSFAMPNTPPFAQGVIYTRFRCSTAPGLGPDGPAADGEVEDHAASVAEPLDWGDAPDAPYPTLSTSNGASHLVTAMGPRLGALVDVEMEGQSSAYADGDDQLGLADEDGVLFTAPLLPGRTACVDVTVDPTGIPGVLDGWIDFDGDGAWASGLPEQVFTVQPLVLGLNSNLCFTVPATAPSGYTYARFRISSQGGLLPTGPAADGEVEDYRVRVEAVKWAQPPVRTDPDPTACYWGWDELSRYEGQQIVADDWRCEDARPVTDIHWWGSYREWELSPPPQLVPVAFHLGIWTDVPANPEPFSHPGSMIWEWIAPYPEVHERAAGCDFHPGMMQFPDTCFEYHVDLPPHAWFYQEPDDHVYWLSIAAIYPGPGGEPVPYPWGWKTRPHFSNDDAVRIFAPTAPQLGSFYQFGEPIMLGTESWDLAFVLTTAAYDYGDAAEPPYPTLLASDGARHAQVAAGPLLGSLMDAEGDGQPSASARGDDLAGLADEDGVSFIQQLEPGQTPFVQLSLASSRYGCYLNAWIDFNRDGVWDNSAGSVEHIYTDFWLYAYGIVGLQVSVPPWPISAIGRTSARFRCASATGLAPTGPAADGEVEDYRVEIIAPPAPPVVSIAISNTTGVRLTWPQVTLDIYGNAITADGYHIYRATAPYAMWGPAASLWGVVADPVTWDDPNKVGDPTVNYYYTVDTVLRDINGFEVYSVRSNEVAEFDFALTPGSP